MKAIRPPVFLLSCIVCLLAACNGGGMTGLPSSNGNNSAVLNLAIADTPVDNATSVTITFTGVEIQPAGNNESGTDDSEDSNASDDDSNSSSDSQNSNNPGSTGSADSDSDSSGSGSMNSGNSDSEDSGSEPDTDNSSNSNSSKPLEFDFATPKTIDLMAQQGVNSASLLSGVTLPAGHYAWIRLKVDTSKSTITLNDGTVHPLTIPSGDESGLKLVEGFTVAAGGAIDFTIDFDLRRSISYANGKYILNPTLRLINNEQVGMLTGTVSNTFTIGSTAVSDSSCSPAVYIYSGSGVTPVDINPTSSVQPVATASVKLDNTTGNYAYAQAYLAPGDYTLAMVCAAGDDPAKADTLTFSAAKSATVTAAQTTTVDFP